MTDFCQREWRKRLQNIEQNKPVGGAKAQFHHLSIILAVIKKHISFFQLLQFFNCSCLSSYQKKGNVFNYTHKITWYKALWGLVFVHDKKVQKQKSSWKAGTHHLRKLLTLMLWANCAHAFAFRLQTKSYLNRITKLQYSRRSRFIIGLWV